MRPNTDFAPLLYVRFRAGRAADILYGMGIVAYAYVACVRRKFYRRHVRWHCCHIGVDHRSGNRIPDADCLDTDYQAPAPAAAPAVQKVAMPEPAPAPVIEEGIPGEVIAAIAAAVYCAEGVSLSAVRSIRRVKSGSSRSAWGMAGVLDNTRPF